MPRRAFSPAPRPYAGAQFGKTALTRVCRRAGMQRIAGDLYPVLNAMLDRYCSEVLVDAVMAAQVKGHKTVSLEDMRFSLQNRGEDVYGLGSTVARPSRRRPRDEAKEKEAKGPAAPAEPAPAVLALPAAPASQALVVVGDAGRLVDDGVPAERARRQQLRATTRKLHHMTRSRARSPGTHTPRRRRFVKQAPIRPEPVAKAVPPAAKRERSPSAQRMMRKLRHIPLILRLQKAATETRARNARAATDPIQELQAQKKAEEHKRNEDLHTRAQEASRAADAAQAKRDAQRKAEIEDAVRAREEKARQTIADVRAGVITGNYQIIRADPDDPRMLLRKIHKNGQTTYSAHYPRDTGWTPIRSTYKVGGQTVSEFLS